MRKLHASFRQGAKSCNEWRDTLFYTGLIALYVAATQWDLNVSASELLDIACMREGIRQMAWSPVLPTPGRSWELSLGALFCTGAWILLKVVVDGLSQHDSLDYVASRPVTPVALVALLMACALTGGIRRIYSDYQETMFDWPRKILPPRKPRRNPALQKLLAAWASLKGQLAGPLPQHLRAGSVP